MPATCSEARHDLQLCLQLYLLRLELETQLLTDMGRHKKKKKSPSSGSPDTVVTRSKGGHSKRVDHQAGPGYVFSAEPGEDSEAEAPLAEEVPDQVVKAEAETETRRCPSRRVRRKKRHKQRRADDARWSHPPKSISHKEDPFGPWPRSLFSSRSDWVNVSQPCNPITKTLWGWGTVLDVALSGHDA